MKTKKYCIHFFRRIGGQKKKTVHNKDNRPHLYGESVEYVTVPTDTQMGTLKVTGFLRGSPLNVNNLVHIPGLGDFQMSQIDAPTDHYKIDKSRDGEDAAMEPDQVRVFSRADPAQQVSLQRENIPDEMDAEQTWPTEDEIALAREGTFSRFTI